MDDKLIKTDNEIRLKLGEIKALVTDIEGLMSKNRDLMDIKISENESWRLQVHDKIDNAFDLTVIGKGSYSSTDIAKKIKIDSNRANLTIISRYIKSKGFTQNRTSIMRYFRLNEK